LAFYANYSVSTPKKIINNKGDIILPCGTPFSILKYILLSTDALLFFKIVSTILNVFNFIFSGVNLSLSICFLSIFIKII